MLEFGSQTHRISRHREFACQGLEQALHAYTRAAAAQHAPRARRGQVCTFRVPPARSPSPPPHRAVPRVFSLLARSLAAAADAGKRWEGERRSAVAPRCVIIQCARMLARAPPVRGASRCGALASGALAQGCPAVATFVPTDAPPRAHAWQRPALPALATTSTLCNVRRQRGRRCRCAGRRTSTHVPLPRRCRGVR